MLVAISPSILLVCQPCFWWQSRRLVGQPRITSSTNSHKSSSLFRIPSSSAFLSYLSLHYIVRFWILILPYILIISHVVQHAYFSLDLGITPGPDSCSDHLNLTLRTHHRRPCLHDPSTSRSSRGSNCDNNNHRTWRHRHPHYCAVAPGRDNHHCADWSHTASQFGSGGNTRLHPSSTASTGGWSYCPRHRPWLHHLH